MVPSGGDGRWPSPTSRVGTVRVPGYVDAGRPNAAGAEAGPRVVEGRSVGRDWESKCEERCCLPHKPRKSEHIPVRLGLKIH